MTLEPPRVIPCLLLEGERLVKTRQFRDPVYVGDPVNVISIFNSFEVDEIFLLDIQATVARRGPSFEMLARVADEAMIPLAYGGGVTSSDEIGKALWIGYEKVVVNSALVRSPELVAEASRRFGSQAIVASIDARRAGQSYEAVIEGGRMTTGREVAELARTARDLGAGEILLTSVDRDGMMDGFDIELVKLVSEQVDIPVVACGGAGRRAHLADPITQGGAAAVAAGSVFVFQGQNRSVLVNFPSRQQLRKLFDLPQTRSPA